MCKVLTVAEQSAGGRSEARAWNERRTLKEGKERCGWYGESHRVGGEVITLEGWEARPCETFEAMRGSLDFILSSTEKMPSEF